MSVFDGKFGSSKSAATAAPEQPASQPTPQPTQNSADAPADAPRQTVKLDVSGVKAEYVNFCIVKRTPEEVVLDFGLNSDAIGGGESTIRINQRVVCNYYTAKRLLSALATAVQSHEQVFGQLEMDVNKRVQRSDSEYPAAKAA